MDDFCQPSNSKTGRILEAARDLFLRHGYGATCMDAVARAAGVSKVTVYTRFECKSKLFAGVIADECARCTHQLALPDVRHLDAREALTRIGANLMRAILEPRAIGIFRVVVAETARFPELGKIFYESGPAVTLTGVAEYLEQAGRNGALDIADAKLAAGQFVALVRGYSHMRGVLALEPPQEHEIGETVERAVETFLRAYRLPERCRQS
jgi:TetR/AcrR family transcriptional repressor of mexJK operon